MTRDNDSSSRHNKRKWIESVNTMDPFTQGTIGGIAAMLATRHFHAKRHPPPTSKLKPSRASMPKPLTLAAIGFLAGMAADLDVLIRSDQDPLLFLTYHRQFTHSLLFIPIGGLLISGLAMLLFEINNRCFKRSTTDNAIATERFTGLLMTTLAATCGYASHALLDACTSYGTQLLWPLSSHRFAWNLLSVIDPVYTLGLLFCLWQLIRSRRSSLVVIAIGWILFYPLLGWIQQQRALSIVAALADQRQHIVERVQVKPSFGNLIVWKMIYESNQRFYVDAVHLGMHTVIYPGDSIEKFQPTNSRSKQQTPAQTPMQRQDGPLSWLDPNSQQAIDIARFRVFSDDYLALAADDPYQIIDIRYSMMPNEIDGLWWIQLSKTTLADEHVGYHTKRTLTTTQRAHFINMLLGRAL